MMQTQRLFTIFSRSIQPASYSDLTIYQRFHAWFMINSIVDQERSLFVANVSYESQRIRAFDLTHLEEQNRRFVRYYIHCRNNTYDMSFIYEYY